MGEDSMSIKYINEIADALIENHAALMVGAGFSKNAEKVGVTDKKFLDWNELSDLLYETVYNYEKDNNNERKNISPLRIAQEVEVAFGRPKLEKLLKEAIPDMEYAPTDLYVKLLEMPWRDVFTTNYDTLLERAAEKVTKRRYNVIVCQEDLVNSNEAPRILKLHGSFPAQRPFIITEEDYRTYPVKFAALVNTVQQALLENVFCMIGFSCEDPNFISWIGWIHDNLGINNSQKIYMISVTHIEEVRRKVLQSQNILVVDLDRLWPDKNDQEKIGALLDILKQRVEEEDKRERWFNKNQYETADFSNYFGKTQILKSLNETYPGWIYMPWKMKEKVSYLLQKLDPMDWQIKNKFDDISNDEKINYMYQYVKFSDIAGRPLLSQNVKMFWNALEKDDTVFSDKILANDLERKKQTIYLQLLRAFRELADWQNYDACHKKINIKLLDYDEKQFLYACDWWEKIYRFQSYDMNDLLDKWKLSSADVYWIFIKASMYAVIGETSKADEILTDNLTRVRKELFKTNNKEYLSSIEDCSVSLINYIRMATFENNTEERVYESDISWGNENERYYLTLKSEEDVVNAFEVNVKFDLTKSYTEHWGNDSSGALHALEYLRFLEQTGHPFRLQNVTNTKGLQSTIKLLFSYYPHWCLVQMLMARDTKMLDCLFGRAKLANETMTEVDDMTNSYINYVQVVEDNVRPKDSQFQKSFFDQAASVLPEILARFCCKCSTNTLDKILDISLEICLSNIRSNFKRMDCLLKSLVHAYTIKEQEERLEKILRFPIGMDRMDHYCDPVCFLYVPKKKYTLDENVYDRTIFQIKESLKMQDADMREYAKTRFIALAQIVNLQSEDENYLYNLIEQDKSIEKDEILYDINPVKYESKANEIFENLIQRMKKFADEEGYAVGGYYKDVISILRVVNIQNIDILNAFSILIKFAKKQITWNKEKLNFTDDMVKESFDIASGLLVLLKKSSENLARDVEIKIKNYLNELHIYMPNMVIINMLWSCFGIGTDVSDDEFADKAIICEEKEVQYIIDFYNILFAFGYQISKNKKLLKYSNIIFKAMANRVAISKEEDLLRSLKLCHSLLQNKICLKSEIGILINALSKIKETTIINNDDSEEKAISKLQCRIKACEIAQLLYATGMRSEILEQWKYISEDDNEFVEIRNIDFSEAISGSSLS